MGQKGWTCHRLTGECLPDASSQTKSGCNELVRTQAGKIEEMEKQVADFSQMGEGAVKMMITSRSVIEAQERAINELRKIVTEDSKLTDTYRKLKEVNLLKTSCDIPPYLSAMADSLSLQHEEISELKAVLKEENSIRIMLSNITTEMDSLKEAMQAARENQEALDKCQGLLRTQSSGINILRTLASHTVSRNNSLQDEEIEAHHPSPTSPSSPSPSSPSPASTPLPPASTTHASVLARKEVCDYGDYDD